MSPRAGLSFLYVLWVTELLLFTGDLQKEEAAPGPHVLSEVGAPGILEGCTYCQTSMCFGGREELSLGSPDTLKIIF